MLPLSNWQPGKGAEGFLHQDRREHIQVKNSYRLQKETGRLQREEYEVQVTLTSITPSFIRFKAQGIICLFIAMCHHIDSENAI